MSASEEASTLAKSNAAAADYDANKLGQLKGLEAVRKKPGMYIGGTDERALHHLVAEVLDNSMDEAVAGHASRIEVELDKDETSFALKAELTLSIPGADKTKLQALIEEAHQICPYSKATRNNIPVTLTVA